MRSIVTILAFAGKEIRQVLHQGKLMSALVVGPFIILGLFAAGFQANPPSLQTLVVLPEGTVGRGVWSSMVRKTAGARRGGRKHYQPEGSRRAPSGEDIRGG